MKDKNHFLKKKVRKKQASSYVKIQEIFRVFDILRDKKCVAATFYTLIRRLFIMFLPMTMSF